VGDDNTGHIFWRAGEVSNTINLGVVANSWTIAQTGDYNDGGASDILWIDNAGNVSVWFLSDAAISSSTNLGNVGTTWAVQAQNSE
jgi:hypothetical protein